MRRIYSILFLSLAIANSAFAQAPQGINYQAVALNSGVPVANQPVGVRLSILDGSATGTVIYQETQNPTTDNTGLFSIVIGNGTVVSGIFNTINWGNGSKWLKTEIDITGGTNYILMGNSQFMSVPYALYANKSGFTSGSFTCPDGFEHVTPVLIQKNVSYTVPVGKNLYLPTAQYWMAVDGDTLFTNLGSNGGDSKTFVGVGENSSVSLLRDAAAGFLADKTVTWKTFDLAKGSFTVPANKQFLIVNISGGCPSTLNGTTLYILANTILDEGMVLSSTGCATGKYYTINGYFKDK